MNCLPNLITFLKMVGGRKTLQLLRSQRAGSAGGAPMGKDNRDGSGVGGGGGQGAGGGGGGSMKF